jgi:hypothetical protein
MSSGVSRPFGPEGDLLRKGLSFFLLWCVPWCAFALGFIERPALRTVLWTASLAVIGVACLVNASRCGRVHCRFTGPFFILGAFTSLGYGLGILPLGPSGWNWIGIGTIVGGLGLACIPELLLGTYRSGSSAKDDR